jgi:hypothetical protein
MEQYTPLYPDGTFPYVFRKQFMEPFRPASGIRQVFTHNCLTGGTWVIPDEKQDSFLRKYADALQEGKRFYFVERLTPDLFRFFVDTDIIDDKKWSDDDVKIYVTMVQRILFDLFGDDKHLNCIVSRCKSRPKGTKWKTGIHLIWPDLLVDGGRGHLLLTLLQQGLQKLESAIQCPEWKSWIDPSVLNGSQSKTGLRMHGSYKCETCPNCSGNGYLTNEIDHGDSKEKKAEVCQVCQVSRGSSRSIVEEYVASIQNGIRPPKLEYSTKVCCLNTLYEFLFVVDHTGAVIQTLSERCSDDLLFFLCLRSVRYRPNMGHSMLFVPLSRDLIPIGSLPSWFDPSSQGLTHSALRLTPEVRERLMQNKIAHKYTVTQSIEYLFQDSLTQRVQQLIRLYAPQYQNIVVHRMTINQCQDQTWRGFVSVGSSCKWCPVQLKEHKSNHVSFVFEWRNKSKRGVLLPRCNDSDCQHQKRQVKDRIDLPEHLTLQLCGQPVTEIQLPSPPPAPSSSSTSSPFLTTYTLESLVPDLANTSASSSTSSSSSSSSTSSSMWEAALTNPYSDIVEKKKRKAASSESTKSSKSKTSEKPATNLIV